MFQQTCVRVEEEPIGEVWLFGFHFQDEALRAVHVEAEVFLDLIHHDVAFIDDDHPVAHGLNFLHDMAGEQDGLFAAQLLDQLSDLHDLVGIESAGGFVQNQYIGIVQNGLREAYALLVAFGEGADLLV